jgi:hypothetical protein
MGPMCVVPRIITRTQVCVCEREREREREREGGERERDHSKNLIPFKIVTKRSPVR